MHITTKSACVAVSALVLGGCASYFPSIGPSRHHIEHPVAEHAEAEQPASARTVPPIRIVDVNEAVTQRLVAQRSRRLFSQVLSNLPDQLQPMGSGDYLAVTIGEAAPATLFGSRSEEHTSETRV